MSERTSPAAPFFTNQADADLSMPVVWPKPEKPMLWQIPARFSEIEAMLADGELSEEDLAKLADAESDLKAKVQSCLCVARNFEARSEARYNEGERLRRLAETDSNNADRLTEYVERVLKQLAIDKIETDLFRISFRSNPPKVVVADDFDISTLPDEWIRVVPEKKEIDKKAVLEASKETPLPEGLSVEQTKRMVVR